MAMFKSLVCSILFVLLVNCGGSSSQKNATATNVYNSTKPTLSADNIAIPDNSGVNDYRVLFFGNSHVVGLPYLLKTLIEHGLPEKTAYIKSATSGDYLQERLSNPSSVELLTTNQWSHVVLQAQKYSQSGVVNYPTSAAQTWIQLAKTQSTTPVLFPEHPQRGNDNEGRKVHDLHLSIAALQASCVAPVGLAWDRALALQPALKLHADDGNHAALMGALLTSLVFYEVVTGMSADILPYIDSIDVEKTTQDFLGQVASETILNNIACRF